MLCQKRFLENCRNMRITDFTCSEYSLINTAKNANDRRQRFIQLFQLCVRKALGPIIDLLQKVFTDGKELFRSFRANVNVDNPPVSGIALPFRKTIGNQPVRQGVILGLAMPKRCDISLTDMEP